MPEQDAQNPDKQIAERLHQIFPDFATQTRMIDILSAKKPKGWSKKSNAPYYKKFYAEQLRTEIDKHIASKGDIIFRYDKFCTGAYGSMTKNTLYQRINQSVMFILDWLDPADSNTGRKKYHEWRESVRIGHKEGVGVVLAYIPELRYDAEDQVRAFSSDPILSADELPVWRRRMNIWLEDIKITEPYVQSGLCLTGAEVTELKLELSTLEGIMATVKPTEVRILKVGG